MTSGAYSSLYKFNDHYTGESVDDVANPAQSAHRGAGSVDPVYDQILNGISPAHCLHGLTVAAHGRCIIQSEATGERISRGGRINQPSCEPSVAAVA